MKKIFLKYAGIGLLALLNINSLYAENIHMVSPLTLTPVTTTNVSLPSNSSAIIQYTVTKNSPTKFVNFGMKSISGVTVVSGNPGECVFNTPTNPTAPPTFPCTLTLFIEGSTLNTSAISAGPSICPTSSSGNPTDYSCSIPCNPILVSVIPAIPLSAYITNQTGGDINNPAIGKVTRCEILDNGLTFNCAFAAPFEGTKDIKVKNNSVFLIADSEVQSCDLDVANCVATLFPQSNWLAFNNDGTKLLVTGNQIVNLCDVSGSVISNCQSSGVIFDPPVQGVAFSNTDSIVYIINGVDKVTNCTLNFTNNTFDACPSSVLGLFLPVGISVIPNSTVAQITVGNGSGVQFCTNTSGNLTNCVDSGDVGLLPVGSTGITQLPSGITYVVNNLNNTISRCLPNRICQNVTILGDPLDSPFAIAVSP